MNKEKKEKLILLILLPVLLIALSLRLIGRVNQQKAPAYPAPVSPAQDYEQEEDIKISPPYQAQQDYDEEENENYTQNLSTNIPVSTDLNIKKVEYQSSQNDPLRNWLYYEIVKKQERKEKTQPPNIIITGLIWSTDRPQAIINGKVVSVNDEIAGARLLSVSKDGVTIEYEGFEFFIKKQEEQTSEIPQLYSGHFMQ